MLLPMDTRSAPSWEAFRRRISAHRPLDESFFRRIEAPYDVMGDRATPDRYRTKHPLHYNFSENLILTSTNTFVAL